ncbi:MAG: hypothetical protein EB100_03230, partial [Crocinitomicaceae bacterium]|nr:hypothetical protein [Crocinitomicaceae bacterium]
LCEKTNFKLSDFYDYDYVGGYTPHKWWWSETRGLHNFEDYQCFDGGFSLRNISAMKDVINRFPDGNIYTEDLYFVIGLLKLNKESNENMYKVGLDEKASKFCTFSHYIADSFCVNKYDTFVFEASELNRFLRYCPEFINFTADKQSVF